MRPVDYGLRISQLLAAGHAVTERVKQIRHADHAAVAHDHVALGVFDHERLTGLYAEELVDGPPTWVALMS